MGIRKVRWRLNTPSPPNQTEYILINHIGITESCRHVHETGDNLSLLNKKQMEKRWH